ncbi:hypothetical protein BXY51_005689 [Actinoplanes cyaneus]|nr:hypothetical protein [Actinoplanes cyaneus]
MPTTPKTPKRRVWTKPRTECLESRAEISGYAGAEPWPIR